MAAPMKIGAPAGPHGAIKAPSGPKKPPGKKGYGIVGTGKGGWIYKPVKAPSSKPTKPAAQKPTDWLKPLSPGQIKSQATSTITKAYAPAYSDLNSQATQAKAINDKRSSDDKYYQSWLNSNAAALQSHADAANGQLSSMEQQLTNRQNSLYGTQQGTLVGDANARAGNVSNNQQSSALGNDLAQNQAANEGLLNASATQALTGEGTANSSFAASRANDFNTIQAVRSKQLTDFNTTMTNLATSRSKLRLTETSDIAKEIARLQGVEIQKGQSNRDYAAALEKLQLTAANINSEITSRAAATKLGQQRYNLDLTKAQLSQMNSDRNFKLNSEKFGAATAKDQYERDHGLGPYKPGGSGGPKPLSTTAQNAIYNKIDAVRGQVNMLVGSEHLTPVQAWHLLHTGGYINGPVGANGKPTKRYISPVGDDGILNAAYNARSGGGGLTSGDIAFLKKLGLTDPGSRLSVQTDTAANWRT